MKKIILSTLVASASVLAFSAHASGRINFDGEVVAQTCNVTVNGQATTLVPGTNVSLPHVTQGALANVGDVAGETRFTIGLRDCLATPGTATMRRSTWVTHLSAPTTSTGPSPAAQWICHTASATTRRVPPPPAS
jgi:type 1 fimbria pilin